MTFKTLSKSSLPIGDEDVKENDSSEVSLCTSNLRCEQTSGLIGKQ